MVASSVHYLKTEPSNSCIKKKKLIHHYDFANSSSALAITPVTA